MKKLTLLIAIIFLSACGTRTVYVNTPLRVAPEPAWVKLPASAFQCMTDEDYINLVKRLKQHQQYEETLINTLLTTHED